jgi:hypothetical protein
MAGPTRCRWWEIGGGEGDDAPGVWFFVFFFSFIRNVVVFRLRWWGGGVGGGVCEGFLFLQQKTALETEECGWLEIGRAGRVLLLFVVGVYGHHGIVSEQARAGRELSLVARRGCG